MSSHDENSGDNVELLTPTERIWAFELEEAIYDDNGGNPANISPGSSSNRGLGSREGGSGISVRRSIRTSISNRRNRRSSWALASSLRKDRVSSQLYGKPSDLEIASHAIRAKGDIPRALTRLKRLKNFKDAYGIPEFDYDNDEPQSQQQKATGDGSQQIEFVLQLMRKFLTAYPSFIQKIGLDNHGRVTVLLELNRLRWTQAPVS